MKAARYSSYKPGQSKNIRLLPAHWAELPLKRLFRLEKREPLGSDEIVTAFRYGTVTLRKNRREEGFTNALKEIGYQRIHRDDLVIHAMDAFAGAIGVSDSDGKSSPVYSACTATKDASPHFYAYYLRDLALHGFIESLAKGIRERSTDFRWSDASMVAVPVPPRSEQLAIANFLDRETAKIDDLIAEQQRLIELLQEKRQVVISHAVTKGLNPNAPMKDSGVQWLGEVPEHWGVKRVKQCIDPARPVTYGILKPGETDENGIPMIRAQDYSSEWKLKEGILMVSAETEAPYIRSRVRAGDVLITAVGAGTGNCAVVPDYLDGSNISRASCRISVDNRKLTSSYLLFVLSSIATKTTIELSMRGAAQPVLNNSEVENLLIPLPPLEEQNQLVQVLGAQVQRLDKQQGLAFRQVELLQERRSALISAAVTGQIDVRGLVEAEAGEQ